MSATENFHQAARLVEHDATCATCAGYVRGNRSKRCLYGSRLASAVRSAEQQRRRAASKQMGLPFPTVRR